MTSPISRISSLTIGTVESVSPDEIRVLLDIDSPRNTALNTGVPTQFPKINSFVLIPNEYGAVVGFVVWLGVERSAYPKRQGFKDFGLIDLPFPLRKMSVCPLGTIHLDKGSWRLERGVQSFPSVGDSVIVPTKEQTVAIVTGQGSDGRVPLGTCPAAHDALVAIDPDKLFGRHLAVLGNTGSGKSCTLASLIRSSIESSMKAIDSAPPIPEGDRPPQEMRSPNARFIILDPNGEYSKCFQDLGSGCRIFQVPPLSGDLTKEFVLPAWMWNSAEWATVAQAAPRAQRPLLQETLRNLRSSRQVSMTMERRLFIRCRSVESFLLQFMGTGAMGWPGSKNCGTQLLRFLEDLTSYLSGLPQQLRTQVESAISNIEGVVNLRKYTTRDGAIGFNDFGDADISRISSWNSLILRSCPTDENIGEINEDTPLPFDPKMISDYLEALAAQEGSQTAQFISTLTMRIKGLIADRRMKNVIDPNTPITLQSWLENHIGSNSGANGPIAIIDLSLIPYEVLHLVIAISSRLILESLQRFRKVNHSILPTVLVLEEAHTFVSKRFSYSDDIPNPADMCRSIFERIAREGRKFGLGMVLSSQRPSELSETVLSQCNSFLLHRITNDRDQELVTRLVPDQARGLLRELPSLPTRHCILLGIATKAPVLVEVQPLSKAQRPESDDPDFWEVWTRQKKRSIDWNAIATDWTLPHTEIGEPVV